MTGIIFYDWKKITNLCDQCKLNGLVSYGTVIFAVILQPLSMAFSNPLISFN